MPEHAYKLAWCGKSIIMLKNTGGAEAAHSASVLFSLIISLINGDNTPIGKYVLKTDSLREVFQGIGKFRSKIRFLPTISELYKGRDRLIYTGEC